MSRRSALVLTLSVALFAIAAPIVAAIQIANVQAFKAESGRALGYATDIVRRADLSAVEMENGFRALLAAESDDPCSPAAVALMRQVDIGSNYLQAVGHMVGNSLDCSSLADSAPIDLGPADILQPSGARMWVDVELPFAKGARFVLVEQFGYVAIIHKFVLLDVTLGAADDVAMAIVTVPAGRILTSNGMIDPRWIASLADRQATAFVDDGMLVATVPSTKRYVGAVVALPALHMANLVWSTAQVLVPIGIGAGALLALAVLGLARQQLGMPALIRTALKRNEFIMVYQPIVDLGTGAWVGAEALIRWRRRTGEDVLPALFVRAAEDAGLIRLVTRRVTELVARDAAGFFHRRPDFHIAVNVSSADLKDEKTVDLIERLARRTGAGRGNLILEATESGLIDPRTTRSVIGRLRAAGVRIAIDDFGTGYSSLSYLEGLELDCVKIDKSFVDTLGTGAATSHVVPHIIAMAKSLNLMMIAEGVETEAQARCLRELGVQFAQGWHFSRPLPFAELAEQLRRAPTVGMPAVPSNTMPELAAAS